MSIPFHAPALSDRLWMDELYMAKNNRGCEYSFTNTYCWQDSYHQEVARMDDFAVQRLRGPIGCCYPFPVGRGNLKPVIEALQEDAAMLGEPFHLICVTPEDRAALETLFPNCFQYTDDRFGYDYLYTVDRLADLAGKKLHGKRNHIHRFEEAHPNWRAEVITPQTLPECIEMDRRWRLAQPSETDTIPQNPGLDSEQAALNRAFDHYEALALEGILIRSEGQVLAFTIGRPVSADTFDVNFEKAFGDIQGAYPIVNRELARYVRAHHPNILYMNREDDMGIEGLRKAKLSYYPDAMVEKCSARRVLFVE